VTAAPDECPGPPFAAFTVSPPARGRISPRYACEQHYLKVYAYRIRKKLHDEEGLFLQNDPSLGYRLSPAAERSAS
jgi:hypothetical protein